MLMDDASRAPADKPMAGAVSQTTMLPPHAALNLYLQTSILILDACSSQDVEHPKDPNVAAPTPSNDGSAKEEDDSSAKEDLSPIPNFPRVSTATSVASPSTPDGALSGSAWLDFSLPLHEAATRARNYLMEEMTPDDATQALVLYDDDERARELAAWLHKTCRRVHMVQRAALQHLYPFLFYPGAQSLTLPNEIVPGRLYLGAKVTANAQALRLLQITHVVSLLDRSMDPPPDPVRHLLVGISDTCSADMDGALLQALPFLQAALSEPNGRVLVHCEAGQSRSATVVIAALMANVAQIAPAARADGALSMDEALAIVATQRPNVRPNDGFKACLRRGSWMPTATV